MQPYSMDLRQRVIEAYENGEGSQAELAETFGVSQAWVEKLWRRWRETGSVAPKPHGGGRRAKISGKKEERLRKIVEEAPDATLDELLAKCRVNGSRMCVFRALTRMGITRKKSRSTTQSS